MAATDEIIVAAPYEVWTAPTGEAFPDLADAPAGNWVKLGTNGAENMSDVGVTVEHGNSVLLHTPYGTTHPVKASRDSESLIYTFELWDLTPTEYARIFDNNTVTSNAAGVGTAGEDNFGLYRGLEVEKLAWLFRSARGSAFGQGGTSDWGAQYELPIGVVVSAPTVVYNKTAPAALQFMVQALYDTSQSAKEEVGVLRQMDADAS